MTTYAVEVVKDGRVLFRTNQGDRTTYEVDRLVAEFRAKWPECKVEVIEQTVSVKVHGNWPERNA